MLALIHVITLLTITSPSDDIINSIVANPFNEPGGAAIANPYPIIINTDTLPTSERYVPATQPSSVRGPAVYSREYNERAQLRMAVEQLERKQQQAAYRAQQQATVDAFNRTVQSPYVYVFDGKGGVPRAFIVPAYYW